jgi:metal-responsive CopG/Arc/MetJ family transcriptional regulator
MEYITFSIRIPKDLCDPLDDEAADESRNRNQHITHILKERYSAHAPPSNHTISSQTRALPNANRKTKNKNAVN